MEKIILAGTVNTDNTRANVFVKMKYINARLSITGVVGPLRNGDAIGSCGQIVDTLRDPSFKNANGIDAMALADIWDRWHLNDFRAGSPTQEQFLREHPVTYSYPTSYYEVAVAALTEAGLNPDPATGYRYGSAWLTEDVPADVIDYLFSDRLPASPITPAWC